MGYMVNFLGYAVEMLLVKKINHWKRSTFQLRIRIAGYGWRRIMALTRMRGGIRVAQVLFFLILSLKTSQPYAGISGAEWNSLSADAQTSYVAGIVDAWQAVSALLEKGKLDLLQESSNRLTECLDKRPMPYSQLRAIFSKHLRENADRWDGHASLLMPPVLIRACEMNLGH